MLKSFIQQLQDTQPKPSELNRAYQSTLSIEFCSGRHIIKDDKTGENIPRSRLPIVASFANCRCPKNKAEGALFRQLSARGWILSKKGWPDFFAIHPGKNRLALIEVKPRRGRQLKRQQRAVMQVFSLFNVPCFLWTPDSGFTPVYAPTPEPFNPISKCMPSQQQTETKEGS